MRIRLCAWFGLLSVAGVAVAKDPPALPRTMPGDLRGSVQTGWLAPFVHSSRTRVGDTGLTTVRWFSTDGKIVRELSGQLDGHPEFICQSDQGRCLIWGLSGDWRLVLPQKEDGYITATRDGRAFLHQHQPQAGQIAVDVYVAGKLVRTLGPYWQHGSHGVHPGVDGSLALVTWKDATKKASQVVAARPDGSIRFEVECDDAVLSPVIAPDARGVLLRPNGEGRNTFSYWTGMGKVSSFKPGFNAECVTWLPDSATALMSSSVGHDYRFHLVDWSTGKELWNIRHPCPAPVPGSAPRVVVAKNYLLFAGREFVKLGGRDEPVRCLYAVDAKTGKTVARWHPSPLQAQSGERAEPWFAQIGARLYLVTPDEFSEIALDDIAAKTRGWK